MTNSIAALRSEIDSLEGRQIELEAERSELAFEAMVEKNTKATKRLDEINTEIGRVANVTLPTLRAALDGANKREAVARTAAADEDARSRAEKARPIIERLIERGAAIDHALKTFGVNFTAIQADLDELQRLGVPTPSRSLVAVNLRRAHDAGLPMDGSTRPVPPMMRHSFDSLLRFWAQPGFAWISTKLTKAANAA
jgi:hypothetical protein